MATAEVTAGVVTFTYNADGQRTAKQSTDGSVTGFLFDYKKLLAETDEVGGDVSTLYATTTDQEFGDLIGEDGEYTHQYDAQANTNALLDTSGAVEATYKYFAFGNVSSFAIEGDAWASLTVDQWANMTIDQWASLPVELTTNMLAGGKKQYYLDPETQLFLLGIGTNGNYYDANTTRFLSEDPIRQAGGNNLGEYVDNNPINKVDPSGHDPDSNSAPVIDPLSLVPSLSNGYPNSEVGPITPSPAPAPPASSFAPIVPPSAPLVPYGPLAQGQPTPAPAPAQTPTPVGNLAGSTPGRAAGSGLVADSGAYFGSSSLPSPDATSAAKLYVDSSRKWITDPATQNLKWNGGTSMSADDAAAYGFSLDEQNGTVGPFISGAANSVPFVGQALQDAGATSTADQFALSPGAREAYQSGGQAGQYAIMGAAALSMLATDGASAAGEDLLDLSVTGTENTVSSSAAADFSVPTAPVSEPSVSVGTSGISSDAYDSSLGTRGFANGANSASNDAANSLNVGGDGLAADKLSAADLGAAEGAENAAGTKTYQTYTKTNPDTGEVYSGKTSGTGTPYENVAARDRYHHMNDEGFAPAQLDKSSSNPDAIRGREQQLIDANGGAKSGGGTSGNKNRSVGPNNSNAAKYNQAAQQEFGNDQENEATK